MEFPLNMLFTCSVTNVFFYSFFLGETFSVVVDLKIQFTGRNFILIRIRISINKYIDNMDNMPERKMFGVVIRTMREMIKKNKMIFFFLSCTRKHQGAATL